MKKLSAVLAIIAIIFFCGNARASKNIPEILEKAIEKCHNNVSYTEVSVVVGPNGFKNPETRAWYYYKNRTNFRIEREEGTKDYKTIRIHSDQGFSMYSEEQRKLLGKKVGKPTEIIDIPYMIGTGKVEEKKEGDNLVYSFIQRDEENRKMEITVDPQKLLIIKKVYYYKPDKTKIVFTYNNWKFEKIDESLLDYKSLIER